MQFDYKEWYSEHGQTLNARRRVKYADDKAYRDRVLKTNKLSRERHPRERVHEPPYRLYKGKRVRVFTIGDVAEQIDRKPQVIRLWQRLEVIPESIFGGRNRVYTKAQITILKQVAEYKEKYMHDPVKMAWAMAKIKKLCKSQWAKV